MIKMDNRGKVGAGYGRGGLGALGPRRFQAGPRGSRAAGGPRDWGWGLGRVQSARVRATRRDGGTAGGNAPGISASN